MNLNKSTRYALYATMELARSEDRTVTVGEVASRYTVPEGVLAKVFQHLVRAGLAVGTRGIGGGYKLSRPPAAITVLDVVRAFEPPRSPGGCLLAGEDEACGQRTLCRLGRLFDEVDEIAQNTFASVSLETLVK